MKFRTSRSEALLQPYHFNKDSKVQEQFAFDCDINNIVSGMTAPLPMREPISDEVKQLSPDMYEKALYAKAEAENAFMELPSKVRTFFENNPKNMLEFISKPENQEKCIELGLIKVDEGKTLLTNLNNNLDKVVKNSVVKTVETVTPQESQGG
nr:virion structural protein [Microvirus sp.]CAI9751527.1 virion structural protein [Microvirus sp.]